MNQTIKHMLSFLGGAVAATIVTSLFLPPRLVSSQSVLGELAPVWSLEAFEKINGEMPKLLEDPNITMTVIPTLGGNGYQVFASDVKLRARFGFASWDPYLERVKERMEQLRDNKQEAEQAAPSNH
jgi:hypothetical protein